MTNINSNCSRNIKLITKSFYLVLGLALGLFFIQEVGSQLMPLYLFDEDNLVENLSAACYLLATIVGIFGIWKSPKDHLRWIFFAVFAVGLIGTGDELSFGERLFHWVPTKIYNIPIDAVHDYISLSYEWTGDHYSKKLWVILAFVIVAIVAALAYVNRQLVQRIWQSSKAVPLFGSGLLLIAVASIIDLDMLDKDKFAFIYFIEEALELAAGWAVCGAGLIRLVEMKNDQTVSTHQTVLRKYRDVIIGVSLGLLLAVGSLTAARMIPNVVFDKSSEDVWFQTAACSIFSLANDRQHPKHGRNNTHPFFSSVIHPPTQIAHNVLHIYSGTTLRLMNAVVALGWGCIFFLLLRRLGCRNLDSILFTLLGICSAASVFFFTIPETFSFGSLSLLIALLILVTSQQKILSYGWYMFTNFVTFSFVSTNWLAGILVTLVNHRLKEALQLLANMFSIATILWAVQKLIYPASRFFLDVGGEMNFVNRPETGGPLHIIQSFFYHTLITPAITLINNPNTDHLGWPSIMSVQLSAPGSAQPWGTGMVIIWTLLLLIGFWALFSLKTHKKFRLVLGILLAAQLILHCVYGEETFLYSLHFIVLLVSIAALGALTKLRPLVLILVIILLPAVALNNVKQFKKAVTTFKQMEVAANNNPDGAQ